jgi:hypothetical protein
MERIKIWQIILVTSKDGYAKHQPRIFSPQAVYIHTEVKLKENKENKTGNACTT